MANDHAKDRYDPPALGSDFEKENYENTAEIIKDCICPP